MMMGVISRNWIKPCMILRALELSTEAMKRSFQSYPIGSFPSQRHLELSVEEAPPLPIARPRQASWAAIRDTITRRITIRVSGLTMAWRPGKGLEALQMWELSAELIGYNATALQIIP
jgi:hypothetical protein